MWLLVALLAFPASVQEFQELFQKGMELSEQGEEIAALEVFREAARLQPTNPYVHYNIGGLLERHGRLLEAVDAFRRAAELAPEERAIQHALGESLYQAGMMEEASSALEKASAPPEPIPEALLTLAAVEERLGKTEEALATLGNYLQLRPEDDSARILLGQHLAAARREEEALEVWKAGLVDGAPNAELLYRIGENLSRRQETYDEAEGYLRQAIDVDPEHLSAQVQLGRILSREGRLDEARALLERAAEAQPDAAQVWYGLAALYQQIGMEQEAIRAGERFQALNEQNEERDHREAQIQVTYKRARELLEQGQVGEAEAMFRSVLDLSPDDVLTRAMLAKIAYSMGRLPEAQRWVAEALERDDTNAELHYLHALFATRSGNLEAAEPSVRRSIELLPGFPDAWTLLGSILSDSGRPAEAVECYLRAAALEPSNAMIQLNLASAYRALGKAAEEEQAMTRYRELSGSEGGPP